MPSGIHKVGRSELGYYARPRDPGGLVEPPGMWMGRLAGVLGLDEYPVELGAFVRLLDGVDPISDTVLDPGHGRVENVAYDLVLTAPKSVSLLFALGGPERSEIVAEAHDAAVVAVVGFLERNAATVRRGVDGRRQVIETGALLAAGFQHWTSRVNDPHLHSHLLVTNLAHDPEGRWSALDARELFAHIHVTKSLYAAHLRHTLADAADLRFFERRPGVIDLVGARERAIELFSRRSREIAVAADARGIEVGRGGRVLADATRPAKESDTPWPELVEQWWSTATQAGLSRPAIDELGRASWSLSPPRPVGDRGVVGSFDRPFARRDLLARIADRAIDGAPITTVERIGSDVITGDTVRSWPSRTFSCDGGREWQIPRALPEPRWASNEIASAIARNLLAVDQARRWAARGDNRPVGSVRTTADSTGLARVRRAAVETYAAGGRVAAVAPTPTLAGHFAAVSGLTVSTDMPRRQIGREDTMVVFGAQMMAPLLLDQTLDAYREKGASVIFIDRLTTRPNDTRAVDGSAGRERLVPTESTPTVCIAGDPADLLRSTVEAIAEWRRRGRSPIVVAVEPFDGGDTLDAPILGPRRAAELARSCPSSAAVVIGDDRVLTAAGYRSFGDHRTHVAVEPVDAHTRALLERSLTTRGRDRAERVRTRPGWSLSR